MLVPAPHSLPGRAGSHARTPIDRARRDYEAARDEVARLIPGFNDQLRAMATARGANVVDVYAALAPDIGRYISEDDLHPTADGLRLIGETFYAAVRAKLDSTPTSTSSLFSRR